MVDQVVNAIVSGYIRALKLAEENPIEIDEFKSASLTAFALMFWAHCDLADDNMTPEYRRAKLTSELAYFVGFVNLELENELRNPKKSKLQLIK